MSFDGRATNIPQLDGNLSADRGTTNVNGILCPEVKRIDFYKDGVPVEYEDVFQINPNWDPRRNCYQCNECDYYSSTANNLIKHKKKRHKM